MVRQGPSEQMTVGQCEDNRGKVRINLSADTEAAEAGARGRSRKREELGQAGGLRG